MRSPIRFQVPLVVLWALTSACVGGPPPAPEPLPFHVALVPLDAIQILEASENREGAPTKMLIQTDPALLSELLVTSLEQDAGFAHATLLEPDEAALPENATQKDWNRMWIDQANEVHADLIVVCDMRLSPVVYQNPNSRFLVNIPVWFMVGPIAWFLRDRTYHMDAHLEAGFFATERLDRASGIIKDLDARVAVVDAHFGELDQNFISRAHGRLGRYALTIIVPPGFVAKQSDAMAASLTAATEVALCQGLGAGVQLKAGEIVRADYLAPFYLDTAGLELVLQADETFLMRGIVRLEENQTIQEMDELRVLYSDAEGQPLAEVPVELKFSPHEPPVGRWTGYPFEATLTPPLEARLVRLAVGESVTLLSRTYTLALPGLPAEIPVANAVTGPPLSQSEQ